MNEYAAYINTAMPSCGGRRIFVAPGYDYNASERLILGEQAKPVRDCYWLMAQEQNKEWESLDDRLYDGRGHDMVWAHAFQPRRGQIIAEGAPVPSGFATRLGTKGADRCTPQVPRPWATAFPAQPYARPTYRM